MLSQVNAPSDDFAETLPGTPVLQSLNNPPLPIPARIKGLYIAAGARYQLPWTLLAGIGMAETRHGRLTATSSAGAQGLMQFLPASWAAYGMDGDGDGRADITNDADSIHSAAHLLTTLGVTTGPEGVRRALYGYNHADWYVNDVLTYAHAYGGGTITPTTITPGSTDPGALTECGPDTLNPWDPTTATPAAPPTPAARLTPDATPAATSQTPAREPTPTVPGTARTNPPHP